MKKIIFIFFIFISVVGCLQTDKTKNITIKKPDFEEFISVCVDSIYINQILDIWYWKMDNNRVYIYSPRSTDAFLFVYSFPKFDFLYQYGARGNGPGEFISVMWGNTKSNDEIILYDIMKRKMYSFISSDSTCLLKQSFNLYGESESDRLSKPFTMVHKLNDSLFMMKVDLPDESYLEIVDLNKGKVISQLHSFLERPERSAYTPFDFVLESYGKTVISAFKYIDRIEISEINEKFKINPQIIIIGNGSDQSYKNDLDDYYSDVVCDGKRIYAVNQNGKSQEKSSIEIYELDGTACGLLLLDQYVELILLSTDSKNIYGYNSSKESSFIYIYEVPKELSFR